jgi:hypothetical protein
VGERRLVLEVIEECALGHAHRGNQLVDRSGGISLIENQGLGGVEDLVACDGSVAGHFSCQFELSNSNIYYPVCFGQVLGARCLAPGASGYPIVFRHETKVWKVPVDSRRPNPLKQYQLVGIGKIDRVTQTELEKCL